MDTRTQQLLVDRGVMDAQRVTARPTLRHCRTCRRAVLVALADDGPGTPGVRVTLDPRRLTPYGELVALTHGLDTYHHTGGHIAWRDPVTITRRPAGQTDVHHTHRCDPLPGIEYWPTEKKYAAAESDPLNPPF